MRLSYLWEEVKGYLALFLAIAFFSGFFPWVSESLRIFDFTSLMGHYGTIVGRETFVGHGGSSIRHGFLFGVSMIPVVMFSMGVVAMSEYYGAVRAAQEVLTPVMRPLFGLPGCCGLALVSSLNSTDAGAAMTRDLVDTGRITSHERLIFTTFQFASASAVANYMLGAPILSEGFTVSFLLPLAVILVMKVAAANIARLAGLFWSGEAPQAAQDDAKKAVQPARITQPARSGYAALLQGMSRGWDVGVKLMLPNLMLAFMLIAILKDTGVLKAVSVAATPLMELFGVPGIAVTALVMSLVSGVAGFSVAASLHAQGLLSAQDVTVITPALFLICSQVQYIPRIFGVTGLPLREYRVPVIAAFIVAFASMPLMRLFL